MKTLKEKKLLVQMSRAFGQPVDPALLESIELEEKLAKMMFKEEKIIPEPVIMEVPQIEVEPEPLAVIEEKVQPTAQTNIVPDEQDLINQTMSALKSSKPRKETKIADTFRDKELDSIRRSIADLVRKVGTLSWGGGGTGVVRIYDTDDYVKSSGNDERKFMTYRNGMFQMDFVNPREIISNTAFVTSDSYNVTDNDYYIGVNYNGKANVFLPTGVETGRIFVVKDESGKCSQPLKFIDVRPTGSDTIEGTNFVRLAIDYGSLTFIYRNGWRVI